MSDSSPTSVEDSKPSSTENVLSRLMRKRYGIGMILALTLWPFAGFSDTFEAILRNGLLIETYRQLGFVAFVNTVAFFLGSSIQRLLNSRIPGYWWQAIFGDGNRPWSSIQIVGTIVASAITPSLLAMCFADDFSTSASSHFIWSIAYIGMGLISGCLLLFLASVLKCLAFGSDAKTQNYFPFEARNRECPKLVKVVLDLISSIAKTTKSDRVASWLGIERIDTQFLSYLLVLGLLHWGSSEWIGDSESWLTSAPAMVVVLIWIGGMVFSGIANAFDRHRLPVVAIMVLGLTIWLSRSGSTSDFQTLEDKSNNGFVEKVAAVGKAESDFLSQPLDERKTSRVELIRQQTASLEDAAWNAIVKRMGRVQPVNPEKGKTLVVVTCPGGGIHAAAWSACVLDRLSTEYAEFADSTCLISGVSGGSVGTLMFVSSRYDADLTQKMQTVGTMMPTTEELHDAIKVKSPALELAARSSLEHIAYGITTDDLYGLIHPSLTSSDRGQRLEDSLSSCIPDDQKDLTLGDWGDRAVDGTVPIVVFNSTDAVSGRRILFDSIPTPRRRSSVGKTSRPLNYRELMYVGDDSAFDVRPATAARTSATFPYVSPFTKPKDASPKGDAVAICDGGYVDNEGIESAVNWIDFLIKRWAVLEADDRPFDRILLLRIEPSYSDDLGQIPDSGGLAGSLRWLVGPAETMLNVRAASQLERGNLESDLVSQIHELNTGKSRSEITETTTQSLPSLLGTPTVQDALKGGPTAVEQSIFQRQGASPQANRKEWSALVDEYQERLKSGENKEDNKPRVQGMFRPTPSDEIDTERSSEANELPVVVQAIRFENANQVIPLNWKLSKKQKVWYLLAWERCCGNGSKLKSTLRRFFTEL